MILISWTSCTHMMVKIQIVIFSTFASLGINLIIVMVPETFISTDGGPLEFDARIVVWAPKMCYLIFATVKWLSHQRDLYLSTYCRCIQAAVACVRDGENYINSTTSLFKNIVRKSS